MTSIQDVADAAYRIQQNAKDVERRTVVCADTLRKQASNLAVTVRGSRTGVDAVRQVELAEREVRQSAARLLALQSTIDQFIKDLTK